MVNVEFTSDYSSHKKGEVVALETNKFKRYIALGIVKFHSEIEAKPKAEAEVKKDVKEPLNEVKPQTKRKHN